VTLSVVSILIASLSLLLSAATLWLTLLRRGTVRMTKPTFIAFFEAHRVDGPKIFLRALLYSTAKRGQILESMFVRLRRGESVQTFNVWAYGERELARGSGLFVGHEGLTCNHHFLLPKDRTQFHFLPGDYILEIHAALVHRKPVALQQIKLRLSEEQASALKEKHAAVYFDWGPDAGSYHAHVSRKPQEPVIDDPNLLALLHLPPGG
jgi:hypothetical protein